MSDVRESLAALAGTDETVREWLAHLDDIGAPEFEVTLPAADDLAPVLVELAVPHEDIGDLVALLPTRHGSPDVWWLLERCTHSLVRDIGQVDGPPAFPRLPESLGPLHRYLYVYVFVAALPQTKAFHAARGIPDVVSRLTLADLGRSMAVHRQRRGFGGLDLAFWVMLHFRGNIYQLGRLQFERASLGRRTGTAIAGTGLPYGPGSPALSVHIPEFYGPLSPHACDESLAGAREFFPRHFPDERYDIAVCHSWLLDEQLADYLPAERNIIRFQRRFRPAYRPADNDGDILQFVFGQSAPNLDDLPRRTRLERAVIDHLRAGHHWRGGMGWLLL
jgi:hypothetical protein